MNYQLLMGFISITLIGVFVSLFQSAKNRELYYRLDAQLLEVKKIINRISQDLDERDDCDNRDKR